MPQPFYDRLKDYYMNVGKVLRGEADAASIFPNPTDIGVSRENLYANFLRDHLPSACNVFFGGFLFSQAGQESKQIDVIVTTDICPQYNFTNRSGQGKTFTCVDGALAAVSIKSSLDSAQLFDALSNLASIPLKTPLKDRVLPRFEVPDFDRWPFKIIYSLRGMSAETLSSSLLKYYSLYPEIPDSHRPNLIHVAGQYCVRRIGKGGGLKADGTLNPDNSFYFYHDSTDVFALNYAIQNIQSILMASRFILFNYQEILTKILSEK